MSPCHRTRRFAWTRARPTVVAIITVLLVILGTRPAVAVELASTVAVSAEASISGRVTGPDGHPLEGVGVDVWKWGAGPVDHTYTAADGTYLLAGLAAGTYTLVFYPNRDDPAQAEYVTEYWNDVVAQHEAVYFALASGQRLTGMDARLADGASISGRLMLDDGRAVPDALVDLEDLGGSSMTDVEGGRTRADGTFSISAVPAGRYRLQFAPGTAYPDYVLAYWGGSPFRSQAASFILTAGETRTGMDGRLVKGGTISGRLTAPDGAPLSGAWVGARSPQYWDIDHATSDYESSAKTDDAGAYVLRGLPPSEYRVEFFAPEESDLRREWWPNGDDYGGAEPIRLADRAHVTGVDAVLNPPTDLTRLAGPDRFTTSAAISAASFDPGAPVAYVANGLTFPDALSGAPVAALTGGPILLSQPTAIPAAALTELKRLQPQRIVILGGPASISATVAAQLDELTSGSVTRLSGPDRYTTSAAISAATYAPGVPVAFVANGLDFPDALSGAPVAGAGGGPVLLSQPNALPTAILAELERLQPQHIIVLGGPASVSAAVAARLDDLTTGSVTRLSGPDRFTTSVAISAASYEPGVPVAYIANAFTFADALSGAPVAGRAGGPVLLSSATVLPTVVIQELIRLKPQRIVILGGTSSIDGWVAARLDRLQ